MEATLLVMLPAFVGVYLLSRRIYIELSQQVDQLQELQEERLRIAALHRHIDKLLCKGHGA
jgi:hypothetical protein